MVYFDHNATTPLLPAARQAWIDATERWVGNPSSPHRLGARADAALNDAREKLAGFLGCDPLDLVWTSGATESNNTVFHHLARGLEPTAEVWVSALEHPGVLAAATDRFPGRTRFIPAGRSGAIQLEWLRTELAKSRPGVVALMSANNETGVLQPWWEALELCRAHAVPFFCDAAQWIGKLPAKELGQCDFVSGCAHKFGGPRGVGFLKCPSRSHLHALLLGGQQEEGRRAGTENVAGVLSMLAALEIREAALAGGGPGPRTGWRQAFVERLEAEAPGAQVLGKDQPCLWNTVSAIMPDTAVQQRWVVKLDKLGFAVSTGSACASGREKPSHVLQAMGLAPAEASRVLRFSSGWETSAAEWTALAQALVAVHRQMLES